MSDFQAKNEGHTSAVFFSAYAVSGPSVAILVYKVYAYAFRHTHVRCFHFFFGLAHVDMVSGLVRENNFVPSRLLREYGRTALELATGAGRQGRYAWRAHRGEAIEAY